MFYSPLRYPGGKNKLAAFVAKLCVDNKVNGHYVEPFSGGSSVALFLLMEGYVQRITINDKDRSIYAFWHSVLNHSEELCERIKNAPVTIENWYGQREVQKNKKKSDLLDLGFSTLFLNRTSRSGIIMSGPIGGVEQKGDYLLNCRFNKEEIISRIEKIAENKKYIKLYKKDAVKLVEMIGRREEDKSNTIFYFDPPYYLKADSLYMNFFDDQDHNRLGQVIKNLEDYKWIVSYDNHSFIKQVYQDFPSVEYSFNHSAFESRQGKEILFFSENLKFPDLKTRNPVNFKKRPTSQRIFYRMSKKEKEILKLNLM